MTVAYIPLPTCVWETHPSDFEAESPEQLRDRWILWLRIKVECCAKQCVELPSLNSKSRLTEVLLKSTTRANSVVSSIFDRSNRSVKNNSIFSFLFSSCTYSVLQISIKNCKHICTKNQMKQCWWIFIWLLLDYVFRFFFPQLDSSWPTDPMARRWLREHSCSSAPSLSCDRCSWLSVFWNYTGTGGCRMTFAASPHSSVNQAHTADRPNRCLPEEEQSAEMHMLPSLWEHNALLSTDGRITEPPRLEKYNI